MGDLSFSNVIFDFPLVALGVIILIIVAIWVLMHLRPPSPFIRGGKNRKPRLFVVDAAAVDARRRVVLIRRDNVEHLVMIGGPNDILLETRIPAPIGARRTPSGDEPAPKPATAPTEPR
ncbi:flagellar biosynthetic protein FliO [Martelella soudanensis]|uniref:flagellar biosynthetic protein FliO n=1 Tax=unclassified Martelella TaxID=2629616 RepID=UPI0015DF5416